jgi:hypothetical protein
MTRAMTMGTTMGDYYKGLLWVTTIMGSDRVYVSGITYPVLGV